jgi:uncharacterized membrane protein
MDNKDFLEQFSTAEQETFHQLEQIVDEAIKSKQLLSQKLYIKSNKPMALGDRVSDKIADFGGSWTFIISFLAILVGWIIVNTLILVQRPFDPYPFILLNLVLSCIAAIQAPVIMMSQNRKEDKDRQRSEDDYLINLKTELEVRTLNEKLDLLINDQIRNITEVHKKQIEILTDLQNRLVALEIHKSTENNT